MKNSKVENNRWHTRTITTQKNHRKLQCDSLINLVFQDPQYFFLQFKQIIIEMTSDMRELLMTGEQFSIAFPGRNDERDMNGIANSMTFHRPPMDCYCLQRYRQRGLRSSFNEGSCIMVNETSMVSCQLGMPLLYEHHSLPLNPFAFLSSYSLRSSS